MRSKVKWVLSGFFALWVIAIVNIAILSFFDLLEPEKETLVVDHREVVKIFVETRGLKLDDEQFSEAIRAIDDLADIEASRIFNQTGSVILNSNSVIAGGRDVTLQFAKRLIDRWDNLQASSPSQSKGQ
jgi:hypothetical protein